MGGTEGSESVTNHKVTDHGKTLARILRPRANEIHASVLRFHFLVTVPTLYHRLVYNMFYPSLQHANF